MNRTHGKKWRPPHDERDAGAAMLVAVMVITVVAVLCTSTAVLATRSTRAAGEARTAGVVKDLANAGLAQGVTYLRETGTTPAIDAPGNAYPSASDACRNAVVDPTAPDWTRASAARVDGGDQRMYAVWIEQVAPATGGQPGAYRVCAEGQSGQGKRTASVVAQYTPAGGAAGPYAVYSKGEINLQSSAQRMTGLSAYSELCIDRKANVDSIGGTDLAAANRPAAAHSMLWVLGANGNVSCDESDSVHRDGPNVDYVNERFPYDTDQAGGSVTGDPHAAGKLALWDLPWDGSTEEPDDQDVAEFQIKWQVPDMLNPTSITALEQRARQQGNHYTLSSADLDAAHYLSSVATPNEAHAVVFLDFASSPDREVELDKLPFTGAFDQVSCTTGQSLIIVVRNADVTANGNGVLRASVVVKDGGVTKMNGTFEMFGGLFADEEIDLSGTGKITLDSCAIDNPPPAGNPTVDVTNYVEYDRG